MPRFPLLLLLLLAACATAPVAPAAVPAVYRTGRDPRFPTERYLVGVGEGPTLEAARKRAIASIAGQLQASVRSSETVHAATRGGVDEEELLQDIRMESRFDRPEWIDLVDAIAVGDSVHALCVLDRRKAAALLEAEQAIHRSTLRLELEHASAADGLRARSDAVAEASRQARKLLPAMATLAVLRGRPADLPPELQRFAEARRALAAERRSVSMRVCVAPAIPGGPADDVARRFDALLAGAGVRALPCEDESGGWQLTGRLIAVPQTMGQQAGSFRRFCTVRLDYRIDGEAALLHGGSAGGVHNRAGGYDFHQACEASAAALAAELAVGMGLRDGAPR